MKHRERIVRWGLLAALAVTLAAAAPRTVSDGDFAFTSISIDANGDCVVVARVPPGFHQVILETRESLDAPWSEAGLIEVQQPGDVEFILARPGQTQFMRLKGTAPAAALAALSSELNYVIVPPLHAAPSSGAHTPRAAVFHFRGEIDGADRITITRDGAWWEHLEWQWPHQPVRVNGVEWDPRQRNYITAAGDARLLPEDFPFDRARLEWISGRDVVALELGDESLIVHINDTPGGHSMYEFKIHFEAGPPKTAVPSPRARLRLSARIDGSDQVFISATHAVWRHKQWQHPRSVRLNSVEWDTRAEPILSNSDATAFLPPEVDFRSARIVSRKGRDLVTAWAEDEGVLITFADNPNGGDDYEIEIEFGR